MTETLLERGYFQITVEAAYVLVLKYKFIIFALCRSVRLIFEAPLRDISLLPNLKETEQSVISA